MTRPSRQIIIGSIELTSLVSRGPGIVSKIWKIFKDHFFSPNRGGLSIVLFACLFFIPTFSNAQVMMTEVMYDLEGTDTGREWVEIYNAGSVGVDLADWKLYEANTNHRLTAVSASVIPAQGFAIIADNTAKFLTDNPSFSGVLFDSVFSLSNEGETLVLRDGSGADIDTFSYTSALGAVGDGMSLQKSGSSWTSALPTIGALTGGGNSQTSESSNQSNTSGSASSGATSNGPSSSHSGQSIASGLADDITLEVSSGRDRLGFVGTPLSFEAKVKKPKDLASVSVSHRWSMGDGSQKVGQFISHSYLYPGDYIVILNSEYGVERAVSKIKVRIVSPQVSLREANQSFIELGNDGTDELNLGGWALETPSGRFVIPQDTIVLSRGSIRLPFITTRLKPVEYVRLVNPSSLIVDNRGVSGNSYIAVDDNGEPIIALGGLTEESIRKQFALASTASRVDRPAQSVNLVIGEKKTENMVSGNVASISTTTQAAAIIYTVGENSPSRGLFRKIVDFFNR
jgi:hypothetical protein